MKLCLLANAASIHTQRWATYFFNQGHAVAVLSLTNAHIPGATVQTVGPDPARVGRSAYLLALPRVRRALRTMTPDIVHGHYVGGYGLLAALSGFHPLVLSAWGSDVLVVPRTNRCLKWIVQQSLRRADLITSMADHMTATIRSLGVNGARVITLPFGVDTSVFHPNRRQATNGVAPFIVSTRNLEPVYNVRLMIEALPKIFDASPNTRAEIIGDGSTRSGLEARARELGIDHRVSFTGRLPQSEIATRLSRADIFVSTSLSDGNNISLNEAMACGAFPVVTDIPANRQWIEHGRNGFLVDVDDPGGLANQVLGGLGHADLRRSAADLNWQIVQQRASWNSSMNLMEMTYQDLIARRSIGD
ncbi:MAG TPA: glycosyltransferase [Bryobacteraceae bacterium]|nr:glycosyltransferase [Bryobacteraceae bacterium]